MARGTGVVIGQVAGQTRIDVVAKSASETTLHLSLTGVNKIPVTTPRGPAFIINIHKGTQLLQAGAPDVPKYALIKPSGCDGFCQISTEVI